MNWVKLENFAVSKGGAVDPAKFPEEVFDLYSIPAYDQYKPDVITGSDIGSAKKIVQPGDVLLSRIVPHIRRVWVVGPSQGRRQIGSGEWLIFRGGSFYPNYLRHMLMADPFHQQFMRTVAGVGGSLLRARPSEVEKIEIPLPPLPEQKRIAAILDKTDSIRRKRQEAVRLTEELLRSVFLDMFGDPVTNPKGWKVCRLMDVTSVQSGATPSTENEAYWNGNIPWVSPKDMKKIELIDAIDHVSDLAFKETNLKKIEPLSILLVVRGMILAHTVPIAVNKCLIAINQDIKAFTPESNILPEFLLWNLLVQHNHILSKVATAAHGTKRLEMSEVESLPVLIPSKELQRKFIEISQKLSNMQTNIIASAKTYDILFETLLQSAFEGNLNKWNN